MSLNSSANDTNPPVQFIFPDISQFTVPITICLLTLLICLVGLVGNGITIYLFCFRNQAEPVDACSFWLLSAIERCLSVCFPIWYKCRRPEHLSAILCGVIWIVSILITVLERFLIPEHRSTVYAIISVLFLIVTLSMLGASMILLIEIQKTSIQVRPIKLYIVVVSAVVTFLISLVPATMVRLLFFFSFIPTGKIKVLSYIMISLCSAINSTVNPYIYIIVGRWKKNAPATKALESVFKEEDGRSTDGIDSMVTQHTDTEPKTEGS
ncbi:mas-related G-protein coupled receptor member H-like [Dendropsophus ebraccatus]|uniref:mas-related G-protein coupled receptor member H-like n=1 Tax=Dendropsophus ebraccatus TaxID=150705 RepID=UPI003831A1F1